MLRYNPPPPSFHPRLLGRVPQLAWKRGEVNNLYIWEPTNSFMELPRISALLADAVNVEANKMSGYKPNHDKLSTDNPINP